MAQALILGIDVGGTSTDAVLLNDHDIRAKAKAATSEDIHGGILNVISSIRDQFEEGLQQVGLVCLGTTQFINALVRQEDLAQVAVLRLCGPATRALPPFCDVPPTIAAATGETHYMLQGGYEYDGATEISTVSEEETRNAVQDALEKGITSFVVSGVFSLTRSCQELRVQDIIQHVCAACGKEVHITVSHEVGGLGLLEREGAAILNAALRPLASRSIPAFQGALRHAGIAARLQLTANSGTLISAEVAQKLPIATIQSGPVNSLRGAAALTGVSNAIVMDIGGTTTDLGVLVNGLPRPAAATGYIAGVRTNFAMPDLHSVGLGGGSHVSHMEGATCAVGPQSVGQHLTRDALCFGGHTCTATDVATVLGRMSIQGSHALPEEVPGGDCAGLSLDSAHQAWSVMQQQLELSVDRMKATRDDVPVIVVGGGAALCGDSLAGASAVIRPEHADVANAVGAAIPQVSGVYEGITKAQEASHEGTGVIQEGVEVAKKRAVEAGAAPESCQVHSIEKIPMAYLPGGMQLVRIRVVGSLKGFSGPMHLASSSATPSSIPAQCARGIPSEDRTTAHERSSPFVPSHQQSSPTSNSSGPQSQITSPQRQLDEDGAWTLSKHDVKAISIGCGILGTGGGGDPYINRLKVIRELDRGGVIRVIGVDAVPDEALVAEAGGMGAPTIGVEKLDAFECEAALRGHFEGDPRSSGLHAVMSCEIGGGNGLEPLAIGARMELPVVDADFMGRAFPELQMMTSAIYGHDLAPAVLADEKGNVVRVEHAASPEWLESLFRPVCTAMGCAAGLSTAPLTGAELRRVAIPRSLTLAWRLGHAVLQAQRAKTDAVAAVVRAGEGVLLFTGKVVEVQRQTTVGFAKGSFEVEGLDAHQGLAMHVEFQNENLVARMGSNVVACVPDLICCLEAEGGNPIPTEGLRYGLRVAILALPAHPMLKTPEALSVVGPVAFGYTCSYEPINAIS